MGLALLVFVWFLLTFVGYMSNNRIRAAMAARHMVWLSGNGGNPTDADAQAFFLGNDAQFAHLSSSGQSSLAPTGIPTDNNIQGWSGQDSAVCSATVTFGMSAGDAASSSQYPFVLMNMNVPFMSSATLDSFTTVSASSAWPGDVGKTWNNWADALSGLASLVSRIPGTTSY